MIPTACLTLGHTDVGEWGIRFIWRWLDLIERGIFLSLALMLFYTFFVLVRFFYRLSSVNVGAQACATESPSVFQASQRALIVDFLTALGVLRGIAVSAPLLGLAGTSYGILANFFRGFAMSRLSVLRILTTGIASTLITAAAGILVAIPAIVVHNIVAARIEEIRRNNRRPAATGTNKAAQALPLRRRFSGLPPYALIAAPVFASVVIVYMWFKPYELPKGLPVRLALHRCEPGLIDRLIVLRITDRDTIFINSEKETWDKLAGRLAEIYRTRQDRTLYLEAPDDVYFNTVAVAIDIARGVTASSDSSRLSVRLITPQAQADASCHAPVWTGPKAFPLK